MLEQAAEACAAQGERLILVVDGLDEDRGVTTGPDAHSIAALLPHDPSAGMRVVVAGRPDPPIPDDVPGWHRLRIPHRPAAASSEYAQHQALRSKNCGAYCAARLPSRICSAAHRRPGELSGPNRPHRRTPVGDRGCPAWGVWRTFTRQ